MFGQTHSTIQHTTIRTTPADAIALASKLLADLVQAFFLTGNPFVSINASSARVSACNWRFIAADV